MPKYYSVIVNDYPGGMRCRRGETREEIRKPGDMHQRIGDFRRDVLWFDTEAKADKYMQQKEKDIRRRRRELNI